MPVPDSVSVNACRRAFLGHLLQLTILLTGFLVVAPDKDREMLSWLFEPHFKWDVVLGSPRVTLKQLRLLIQTHPGIQAGISFSAQGCKP